MPLSIALASALNWGVILHISVGLVAGAALVRIADGPGEVSPTALRQQQTAIEDHLLRAAESMPAQLYDDRPAAGVESLGELIVAVASMQMTRCAAALEDATPDGIDRSPSDKATATAALRRSFVYCRPAFDLLNDRNGSQLVGPASASQQPRINHLVEVVAHNSRAYGTLSAYLRLNHIAPPLNEGE